MVSDDLTIDNVFATSSGLRLAALAAEHADVADRLRMVDPSLWVWCQSTDEFAATLTAFGLDATAIVTSPATSGNAYAVFQANDRVVVRITAACEHVLERFAGDYELPGGDVVSVIGWRVRDDLQQRLRLRVAL